MDDLKTLQDALYSIKPSDLTYEEWLNVGMALKDEGLTCDLWDDWSRSDSKRYAYGVCAKKWDTFSGSGVGVGTIFHYAETYGNWTRSRDLDWDDGIAESDYYHEVLTNEKKEEEPWEMAVRYLETMFQPDESVSFVHNSAFNEKRNKWDPADGGSVRKCSAIIKDLKKYKDLEGAFGTINEEAGAWIRHNPSTGPNDKEVTRFDHVLVESDNLPIDDQKKLLINLKLPITALVESGGKSVHALVKVQAQNETEYKQRAEYLFDYLSKHKFIVDNANKNPARLSRLPGAQRGENIQRLLATNIGCDSWADWIDYTEGIDDDLPPFRSLNDQVKDPPALSPVLIDGILREGCKMIITGQSKAGKTCLSQNLAVCIAEGLPWLGEFQCEQGKVLYINLEVEEASLYQRFLAMYKALGIKMTTQGGNNIIPWNLRGYAASMEKLAPKIIRRCRNTGPYKAIILDPLYKVQQGDENSAEAICNFCNALDKIAHETGAAIIYDHHHPKGEARENVIDRGSGSGVFSRDADAICDISSLNPGRDILEIIETQMKDGEKPMQISFVLRDFKDIEPINIWFRFPLHYIDRADLLNGAPIKGSREDNLGQSSKRTTENERRRKLEEAFNRTQKNGLAKISDMARHISKTSLYRYLEEFSDEYVKEGSEVRKNEA